MQHESAHCSTSRHTHAAHRNSRIDPVSKSGARPELCGRSTEQPQALFDRLTKIEKLKEDFRHKSYVAITDKAKDTIWTFTVPGHPAHPSVVCRRPVQDGAELRLQMNVRCNASEAECQKLVTAFQQLNQRMLREMSKQQKQ